MIKKISYTTLITVVFLVAVVVFEIIHRQTEYEVTAVDGTLLQPIDITLERGFIENLKAREGKNISPDLTY